MQMRIKSGLIRKKIYDDIKTQIEVNLKELDNQSIEIVSCFKVEESFENSFLN